MKLEKQINDYIAREKSVRMTPFLSTRVMAQLAATQKRKSTAAWQRLAISLSMVVAIAMGISLGNSYFNAPQDSDVLVLNDTQIENLSTYIDPGHE